ncbi:AfsA/ScbA, partial [Streptomyces misionensis]
MSGVFPQQMSAAVAHGPVMAVHQEHVHKANSAEVLLSSWRALGRDSYVVHAHWPSAHLFYRPVRGLYDPLLLAESVRQAVPLLSHVAYGVPFGHRQAWENLCFDLNSVAMVATTAPADLDLRITCSDVVRRGERLAALTMAVDITLNGQRLGTARTRFNNQPPAVYRRLRGPHADLARAAARALPPGPPIDPREAARTRP